MCSYVCVCVWWQCRYSTTIFKREGIGREYAKNSLTIFNNHIGSCSIAISIGILKLLDVCCEMKQISNPLVLSISLGFSSWKKKRRHRSNEQDPVVLHVN